MFFFGISKSEKAKKNPGIFVEKNFHLQVLGFVVPKRRCWVSSELTFPSRAPKGSVGSARWPTWGSFPTTPGGFFFVFWGVLLAKKRFLYGIFFFGGGGGGWQGKTGSISRFAQNSFFKPDVESAATTPPPPPPSLSQQPF